MIVRHTQSGPDTHGLTVGREYTVIGIEADDYRLLNDLGEPALFPSDAFAVIDPSRPADWIASIGPDGEQYAYPAPLNSPGFFENFFDHEPAAVAAFWQDVNRRLNLATAG